MWDLIVWFLIVRWKIKSAVKDWMRADANKHKERKQYYWARLESNFCGIRYCKISRHDLQRILQLKGCVDD